MNELFLIIPLIMISLFLGTIICYFMIKIKYEHKITHSIADQMIKRHRKQKTQKEIV